MPKQTRLDDNAQIYSPLKQQTEREKLQDMTFCGKLSYLWEYYKLHAIGAVAVILLIIYFVHGAITPDITTQFYAALVDNSVDTQILEEYKTGFADYIQLDPERERIDLNSSYVLSSDNEYSMRMNEVFSTHLATGVFDVIIAPETLFSDYAYYGYLDKLSEQLPTDVYSSLTDYFYISETEDESDKNAYGIYLNDTELYQQHSASEEPYLLGIVVHAKHSENSVEFIKYLFHERYSEGIQ